MISGFVQAFIDVETVGEISRPLSYKKDIVCILRNQVLLACHEDFSFRCLHSGWEATCHPVHFKWFESVEAALVQRVICSENPKVY